MKGQGCTSQLRVLLWRTQNILSFSQIHKSSSKRHITLSYGRGLTDTTAVPTAFLLSSSITINDIYYLLVGYENHYAEYLISATKMLLTLSTREQK